MAIERDGVEKLSLRACARAIGVDPAAAYRHFATKDDLVGAVAAGAFAELNADMERAVARETDLGRRLLASGLSYASFAIRRPNLFRAMFIAAGRATGPLRPTPHQGRDAYQILRDCLSALADDGALAHEDVDTMQRTLWAAIHGLADLGVLGLMDADDGQLETTCRFIVYRMIGVRV